MHMTKALRSNGAAAFVLACGIAVALLMAPAGSLGGLGPHQAQAADQWGDWTEQYHATHAEASHQCDQINAGISEFGTCRGTPYITSSPYGSNSRLFVWRMIGTQEVCDMEMYIGSSNQIWRWKFTNCYLTGG
jgi:hypothetical protein